jgi:hypothetical protein
MPEQAPHTPNQRLAQLPTSYCLTLPTTSLIPHNELIPAHVILLSCNYFLKLIILGSTNAVGVLDAIFFFLLEYAAFVSELI